MDKLKRLASAALQAAKTHKRAISISLTVFVLMLFGLFFYQNTESVIRSLSIDPWRIILVIFLFFVFFFLHGLILVVLLQLYNREISIINATTINIYSSITNFFGFFQGGIGVRSVYLKHKSGVGYKMFGQMLAIQYLFFFFFSALGASISGAYLGAYSTSAFMGLGAFSLLLVLTLSFFQPFKKMAGLKDSENQLRMYVLLGLLTAAQTMVLSVTHWVEINSLTSVGIVQSLGFASIANFSLLIALTPSGVGVREALLGIFEKAHGIEGATIIYAGVLDRALYVGFLLVAFLLLRLLHAIPTEKLTKQL